jgi:hypothetical protein
MDGDETIGVTEVSLFLFYMIWRFHGGEESYYNLLGYDIM